MTTVLCVVSLQNPRKFYHIWENPLDIQSKSITQTSLGGLQALAIRARPRGHIGGKDRAFLIPELWSSGNTLHRIRICHGFRLLVKKDKKMRQEPRR